MAGTLVTALRKLLYVEGLMFRGAVSEEAVQRIASSCNFINLYQHGAKQFFLNGRYGAMVAPYQGADGQEFFEYDAEIINVHMYNMYPGSGGTTELDILYEETPGDGFTNSIFSTTPKIDASAGDARISIGATFPGCVAPVLAQTKFPAQTALRLKIVTKQTGAPRNCGIVIHYRPTTI